MRRQPSIVVRLFNQVFGAATLTVKPDYEVDRILHVGHEDPVFVLAGLEQLVLLCLLGCHLLTWFFVAQGYEAIGLAPLVRLVAEFALRVSIGFGRWFPIGW